MSRVRWVSTVLTLICKARAIALVVISSAIIRRTSRWRGVSGSWGVSSPRSSF